MIVPDMAWCTIRNALLGGVLAILMAPLLLADMLPRGPGPRPTVPHPPPRTPSVPITSTPPASIPVAGPHIPSDIAVLIGLLLALTVIVTGIWWVRRRRKCA